jgi:hypothetical protein
VPGNEWNQENNRRQDEEQDDADDHEFVVFCLSDRPGRGKQEPSGKAGAAGTKQDNATLNQKIPWPNRSGSHAAEHL